MRNVYLFGGASFCVCLGAGEGMAIIAAVATAAVMVGVVWFLLRNKEQAQQVAVAPADTPEVERVIAALEAGKRATMRPMPMNGEKR